ncbi:MAG: hypothetical protein CMO80_09450 [Verrucomicrobiales bacterium]|nr:hypothetical protein [Verrucomicrobiales bacterium]
MNRLPQQVKRLMPALLALALVSPVAAASTTVLSKEKLKPFLKAYCVKCHGPEKQKGQLRFDRSNWEITDHLSAQQWQDVLDVLNAGDMPPEEAKQPGNDELAGVLRSLTESLKEARHRLADQGREVAMRRLNRREYINTIEHLFGFRVNPDSLPEDDPPDPFDTIGSQQFFSSYHFEKLLELNREIVRDAFEWGNRGRKQASTQIEELEARTNKNIRDSLRRRMERWREVVAALEAGKTWKDEDFPRTLKGRRFDGRELHYYLNFHAERSKGPQQYLSRELINHGIYLTRQAGGRWSAGIVRHGYDPRASYKIRIIAGINEEPPESRMFVSANDKGRALPPLRIYGTAHDSETIEVEHRPMYGLSHFQFQIMERRNRMIDGKKYVKSVDPYGDWASIFVDRMEAEGPFYGPLTFFEKLAFPDGPPKNRKKGIDRNDAEAKELIREFAFEACRRTEIDAEFLNRLHDLYDKGRSSGLKVKEALVDPLAVVLSSPRFLYLAESKSVGDRRTRLTDRELALRLAYFLWSSPPDEALYLAAADGSLRRASVLRSHVDRMLANAKSQAFTSSFMSQWFDLHRFDEIAVNPDEYPHFDEEIRYSARREPERFFEQLIAEDLSIMNLIDSDFVVIDPILALHYGIPNVTGQGFRKVMIPAESPRGGLLGTTAFMTMGSTGDRTSPIIRGTLILDKFLHDPPPPPPPNVPELSDVSKEPLPIRKMIELHQAKPQCASCHAKIDPIGYGLETFDAIGLWRKTAKAGDTEMPIETGGSFPGRVAYKDYAQLKQQLLKHKDKLAQSLIEGAMSYGIGRRIEFSDRNEIEKLTRQFKNDGYRARSLIQLVAASESFQSK